MPQRTVIIVMSDGKQRRYATSTSTNAAGLIIPVFGGMSRDAAQRIHEADALRIIDNLRTLDRAAANRCSIQPAS